MEIKFKTLHVEVIQMDNSRNQGTGAQFPQVTLMPQIPKQIRDLK